jgi:hypothetical protein
MDAGKEIQIGQAVGVGLLAGGLLFIPYLLLIHGLGSNVTSAGLATGLMGGFIAVAGFIVLVMARLTRAAVLGRPCAGLSRVMALFCLVLGAALVAYAATRSYALPEPVTLRQVAGGAAGSFLLLMGILTASAQRLQAHLLGRAEHKAAAAGTRG